MQTYIIMNCDAITMATCMHVEGDTHEMSHEQTIVRLGKTLYAGWHGITTTSAAQECANSVADTRTAIYKLYYSAALT